ncbi:hypothetical protein PHYBLDRAFT_168208 [Phycomyces blakesleeanus NRRL 1555(-)]|uniref:Uncharacterized protein n=1 Tax=Phycomyces blakesleeanus (strain ATCC 8743b / DSM 1359 / FGSC 10004 / NBRC 33097 / NRRL 1555) TaxID=763407 RepID=A0A162UB54_PHYB8|nr:hypothetical protein PHYBLDRAFT_168208 [Phycomyces blakesleeanus NRRL 1555(-)]OAD73773.1 hypothetical protein PHYBLDRAFT_168208 [Phycomyces blakesleeanus NRRL 1555(-)]|eukprot:XP_018291813.1 hypothetical protein PHYBLDRAFT_168208 [Phycomyces blakesleeanus NRRL 1555(-)]
MAFANMYFYTFYDVASNMKQHTFFAETIGNKYKFNVSPLTVSYKRRSRGLPLLHLLLHLPFHLFTYSIFNPHYSFLMSEQEKIRASVERQFVESGEKDRFRLLQLLKERLTDFGWNDRLYAHCRESSRTLLSISLSTKLPIMVEVRLF